MTVATADLYSRHEKTRLAARACHDRRAVAFVAWASTVVGGALATAGFLGFHLTH